MAKGIVALPTLWVFLAVVHLTAGCPPPPPPGGAAPPPPPPNLAPGGEIIVIAPEDNTVFNALYRIEKQPGYGASDFNGGWYGYGQGNFEDLISFGKNTNQSSLGYEGESGLTVDDNVFPDWGHHSCSHTLPDVNSWWSVDLGSTYRISRVVIHFRNTRQVSPVRVLVSHDAETYQQCAVQTEAQIEAQVLFLDCRDKYGLWAVGRHVRIQNTVNTGYHMILCEVRVFGKHVRGEIEPYLISQGQQATTNSLYGGGYSWLAVEGSPQAFDFGQGTCMHTQPSPLPVLKVTLDRLYIINRVVIYNYGGLGNRLRNFNVFVLEGEGRKKFCGFYNRAARNYEVITMACHGLVGNAVTLEYTENEYFVICEFRIFGLPIQDYKSTGNVVSFGRPAESSCDYSNWFADLASDGYTSYPSISAHTCTQANPWWEVNLGMEYTVKKVTVFARSLTTWFNKPASIKVFSPSANQWNSCGRISSPLLNGQIITVICENDGARGQTVRIAMEGSQYLVLTEVYVYGVKEEKDINKDECDQDSTPRAIPKEKLISDGKRANQSSNYDSEGKLYLAANALDKKEDTFTHTAGNTPNDWLSVDLVGEFRVGTVKVWNRHDCCPERLTPLRVEVRVNSCQWRTCATITEATAMRKMHQVSCNGMRATEVRFYHLKDGGLRGDDWALSLGEVQIFGEPSIEMKNKKVWPRNVAFGKPVEGTDQAHLGWAGRLTDNNPSAEWGHHSCAHTNNYYKPWFNIDLLNDYEISSIVVYHRSEGSPSFSNYDIFTSQDKYYWSLCYRHTTPVANREVHHIICQTGTEVARFVRLQLRDTNAYMLCEVQVYGN